MFNVHETGDDKERERVLQQRLESMKRARENYYWATDKRVPVPEIEADGEGPDDGWLRAAEEYARPMSCQPRSPSYSERNPNPGGNTATAHGMAAQQYDTTLPCHNCEQPTVHHSYGFGYPVWHCNLCCTCDLCIARCEATLRRHATQDVGFNAQHEAGGVLFCRRCGAMLRCSVCNGTGPGGHCPTCGKKEDVTGDCPDCDESELQDA